MGRRRKMGPKLFFSFVKPHPLSTALFCNPPMEEPSSSSPAISSIPGEPAILINGVPKLPPQTRRSSAQSTPVEKVEASGIACLGGWMEGREVRKFFGDKSYTGIVRQYGKDSGWYRVVYEDGDFEDLEWQELHEILVPIDITIPLKSLALKVISKGIDLNPQPNLPPKELPNATPKECNVTKELPNTPQKPIETSKEDQSKTSTGRATRSSAKRGRISV